jgi:hypothetical protein
MAITFFTEELGTMRTFHISAAVTKGADVSSIEASYDSKVKIIGRNLVVNSEGCQIVMSRTCEVLFIVEKGNERARNIILKPTNYPAKNDLIVNYEVFLLT